jgi:hypothetical protein
MNPVPSKQDEQRKAIQQCCEALWRLLASLEKTTSTLPHFQVLGEIKQAAKEWPDDRMSELAERLGQFLKTLKETPAADGFSILSGPRHAQFMRRGTCANF